MVHRVQVRPIGDEDSAPHRVHIPCTDEFRGHVKTHEGRTDFLAFGRYQRSSEPATDARRPPQPGLLPVTPAG